MTDIQVTATGLAELQAKANANALLGPPLRDFFQRATLAVQAQAQQRAPVKTRTLRRSLTTEVGGGAIPSYGKVGTTVFYAPFQNFGTSRGIVGKHFMEEGFAAARSAIDGFLATAAKAIEALWNG